MCVCAPCLHQFSRTNRGVCVKEGVGVQAEAVGVEVKQINLEHYI